MNYKRQREDFAKPLFLQIHQSFIKQEYQQGKKNSHAHHTSIKAHEFSLFFFLVQVLSPFFKFFFPCYVMILVVYPAVFKSMC